MTKKLVILLTVLALSVAACGSGTDSGSQAATAGTADAIPVSGSPTDTTGDGVDGVDHALLQGVVVPAVLSAEGPVGALLLAHGEEPGRYATVRFHARLSVDADTTADGPLRFDVTVDGDLDLANEATAITIDLSGVIEAMAIAERAGQIPSGFDPYLNEPIEIRVVGDEGWLKWSLLGLLTGSDDTWLAMGTDDLGSATEQFGFGGVAGDPLGWLIGLGQARADLTDVGSDTVRGVPTTHYRTVIDLATVLAVDPAAGAEIDDEFGSLGTAQFPIDIWIDGDGLVRRYSVELSSAGLAGSLGAPAPGESFTATLVVELYDHGADLAIGPPPADQVIDATTMFGT